MSVIFKTDSVTVLSHKKFIDNCYKNVIEIGKTEQRCFELNPDIFQMISKNSTEPPSKKKRKRKLEMPVNLKEQAEIDEVKSKFHNFISKNGDIFQSLTSSTNLFTFTDTKELSSRLLSGGNPSEAAFISKINNEAYLFPPNCHWFHNQVDAGLKLVASKSFDLIVMDPPWWNKYVRRVRHVNPNLGYQMMWNEDLKALDINSVTHSKSILAIWCTNAPSHIKCVKEELLPHWGFTLLATCFWVKVATDGTPIKEFAEPNQKQPFERIFLAARHEFPEVDKLKSLDGNLIVSVPSLIHSHKPPLVDYLKDMLQNNNSKYLEIFARYLIPGFTSIGNEVLKLQHLDLFHEVSR